MSKTIYIAGPIRGTDDYKSRFYDGFMEVAAMGHVPVNPIELGCEDLGSDEVDQNYIAYLKRDIRTLLQTEGVYLLRGWENSRGARLEKLIAEGLDMTVLYQPEQ